MELGLMKFELQSKHTGEYFLTREQLDLTGATYDCALPQEWCNMVTNKLGQDFYPAGTFVTLYWDARGTACRMYPISQRGVDIFDKLAMSHPELV